MAIGLPCTRAEYSSLVSFRMIRVAPTPSSMPRGVYTFKRALSGNPSEMLRKRSPQFLKCLRKVRRSKEGHPRRHKVDRVLLDDLCGFDIDASVNADHQVWLQGLQVKDLLQWLGVELAPSKSSRHCHDQYKLDLIQMCKQDTRRGLYIEYDADVEVL